MLAAGEETRYKEIKSSGNTAMGSEARNDPDVRPFHLCGIDLNLL
jgi:hypothetical protein